MMVQNGQVDTCHIRLVIFCTNLSVSDERHLGLALIRYVWFVLIFDFPKVQVSFTGIQHFFAFFASCHFHK